jgi:hypothetical protein
MGRCAHWSSASWHINMVSPFDRWEDLRLLLEKALQDGIVGRVREEILTQFYGQGDLQLDCSREEDLST